MQIVTVETKGTIDHWTHDKPKTRFFRPAVIALSMELELGSIVSFVIRTADGTEIRDIAIAKQLAGL